MTDYFEKVRLFTDGGCRGNPGPGAIAFIILDESGNELARHCECIGETTNNRAEYNALIKGLDCAAKHTSKIVNCYLDSELVINQVTGSYRLKNYKLIALYQAVKEREELFEKVTYQHLRRSNSFIVKVDELVNIALDERRLRFNKLHGNCGI